LSEPQSTATTSLAVTGRLVRPEALRLQGNQTTQLRWLRGDALELHYPKAARAAGLDGIVTVDLLVNESGYVLEAQVIGESPAGAGFGLAALDAVKTYEYDNRLHRLVLMSISVEFLP
jgi:TonB family protein